MKLRKETPITLATILLFFIFVETSNAQINFGDNPNFDPYGPGAKVIIVGPPGIFTLPGSETNFTRVCSFSEAINLILDVTGKNKIEFKESIIDMCNNKTAENLDQYVQLEKVGEVTVRSDLLTYLKDKPAEITMRNLPFEEEPTLEVDGKPATNQDIENKVWDQSSKTLKFKAKHFTTYKAISKTTSSIDDKQPFTADSRSTDNKQSSEAEPTKSTATNSNQLNVVTISLILGTIFISLAVIIGAFKIWRSRRTQSLEDSISSQSNPENKSESNSA